MVILGSLTVRMVLGLARNVLFSCHNVNMLFDSFVNCIISTEEFGEVDFSIFTNQVGVSRAS